MSMMSRKEFLRLGAASAAAAALPGVTAAQATSDKRVSVRASATTTTLIRGADVLTMDEKLGELTRTDVLIRDGKIAAIGKNLSADAEIVDAQGMILMPGMIDGHRHVWEIIDLGHQSQFDSVGFTIPQYFRWQYATVVSMTPEDSYLAGLIGGLHAIDAGVTSLVDYAHGQNTEENAFAAARGLKDSGIAGWFGFQLGASYSTRPGGSFSLEDLFKTYWSGNAHPTEAEWRTSERLQKELFSDSSALLQLALGPVGHTGSLLTDIKEEWARIRGMGIRLMVAHMHKPEQPEAQGRMGHRDSGIAELYEAGLLGPDYHISHGNALTTDELKMLRDTGGMTCTTTMGEFPYVMDYFRGPPVHGRARAVGVAAGIGLDMSLAMSGDYFEHVRCAYLGLHLDTSAEGRRILASFRSKDTLDLATAMGARAIRMGDTTGSITVGKRADLLMLRTDRIGFGRAGTLADRAITFANTSDIDSVWIAGAARKRQGKMLGVDWRKLKAQLGEAQDRVARVRDTIEMR